MDIPGSFNSFGIVIALTLSACSSGIPHESDAPTPAYLGRASTHAGSWSGNSRLLRSSGIHTVLAIKAPDGARGKLEYGAPASCGIDLKDAGDSGGAHRYDVTNSDGGACDNALAGHVMVVISGGAASITLFDASGKPLGDGTLQPTQ